MGGNRLRVFWTSVARISHKNKTDKANSSSADLWDLPLFILFVYKGQKRDMWDIRGLYASNKRQEGH